MNNKILLRKVEPDDLYAVNQLYESVSEIHMQKRPDLFKAELPAMYTEKFLAEIAEDTDAEIIVADDDGKICGYASYYIIYTENDDVFSDRMTLRVDEICVSESYRNKGIGKMLMEYMRDVARERGCYDITLFVYDCNKNAKEFYENIGLRTRSHVMEWIV